MSMLSWTARRNSRSRMTPDEFESLMRQEGFVAIPTGPTEHGAWTHPNTGDRRYSHTGHEPYFDAYARIIKARSVT